jgi:uncharacterized membrane protein
MPYAWLKLAHVLAVVLFLGNITTGVFWKAHADATRDPRIIAHALVGIIRSDRLFTIPGVVAIVAFGIAAALAGDLPLLRTGWILWSLVLFTISGFAFMSRVAPLQRRMAVVAQAGVESGQMDWSAYHSLSTSWAIWGGVALLAPLAAAALMVLKPSLPGL